MGHTEKEFKILEAENRRLQDYIALLKDDIKGLKPDKEVLKGLRGYHGHAWVFTSGASFYKPEWMGLALLSRGCACESRHQRCEGAPR
jgi:hypothetical protein